MFTEKKYSRKMRKSLKAVHDEIVNIYITDDSDYF